MFWRSVVVKLWFTIILLVSFVLFILTILLLQYFENFHEQDAEQDLRQISIQVRNVVEEYDDRDLVEKTLKQMVDSSSRVAVIYNRDDYWLSEGPDNEGLPNVDVGWFFSNQDLVKVLQHEGPLTKKTTLPNTDNEILMIGMPLDYHEGAVFVYQSLDIIHETTSQTTKFIWYAAGIAIILTTFFAFFLSTRITSPLIQMRKAVRELETGEFHTKVPILTRDEIGELAKGFNRMGSQLKYHIQALSQEKEQLSSILLSMADGVITLNRSGDMIVTNPPAKRFLNSYFFEKNTGGNNYDQLPNELRQTLEEVVNDEREVMTEISVQGRNYVMIMSPLYDQSFVRGAVAVIRDMTEERKLDKLRKDFIANVSHELRTPISMLQGYSEAIVDGIAQSKEERNELAKIIYDESLRIGRLVNDLLDLARMEAGQIQLHMQSVNLKPYLDKVVRKFRGVAEDKQVDLQGQFEIRNVEATFDPDRIEQVLTNLIDNAIRHTSEDGTVTLSVIEDEDRLNFRVKDTGCGIPEEDLPFIFERFYKSDKARTRSNDNTGTGLGLAIAKNIVDAHNGSIQVHSKVNEGTSFEFYLPKTIKS
ncbi:ATP-binding protein [Salirhabdus salicampi]|uniref:ATP-binding protein n=1 Tax=Salirhabdus salicampi TaxID=476102 RepID=UPI0020C551E3|nr:ATP-binding protein [Salirhabdus salicampi]MCP8616735.1 cell wall metabolism sensor histidine kinase WalK [Salirhabdus salicampi]